VEVGAMPESDSLGDPHNVAVALQAVLLGSERVEEFLTEVARAAAGIVGGDLACGVTVSATTSSRRLGATSDRFAARMDAIQYDIDDGPCLNCLRTNTVITVPDIATDTRWPAFSERGRAEGAGTSMSVPMVVAGFPVGALNLYARRSGALTEADQSRARHFADQAAGAVGLAIRLAASEDAARHLSIALQSRTAIDQAIGVLMGQARIGPDQAFEVMRRRSQHTNTKLRDVAAAVLADIARPDESGGGPSLLVSPGP
jgi:GAF domain-containing protein